MSANLFSRQVKDAYFDFPKKEATPAKLKRQRTLSSELFKSFVLKHYPCVFLDQRLRSRLFR
jgi:hypothetical protein